MRLTVAIVAVVVALWAGYAMSAFLGAYRLADAVQERTVEAISNRIDFPAVRQSLAAQIVRKYVQITGKTRPGSLLEQFAVGIGTSIADPIVAGLVSPEALIDLLQSGKAPRDLGVNIGPMQGLSRKALGSLWRLFMNSELGISRFFVYIPVDRPTAESFLLQFCLSEWTWKLCSVELPERLQISLAQAIAESQK